MPLFKEANVEHIQEIVADLQTQGKQVEEWLVKAIILETSSLPPLS